MRYPIRKVAFPALLLVLFAILILALPSEDSKPQKKKLSGAMKALQLWSAQRAYPNSKVPEGGFSEAWEETRLMRQRSSAYDDSTEPWTEMGPHNIGGRTLCLALHPDNTDILYAGAASGGLWRSDTGGVGADAWDYVDTGFPILGVSSIAFDPFDSDVMYIGTGEAYSYDSATGGEVIRVTRGSYGMGILKTQDGGATWSKSLDWSYAENRGVWMLAADPSVPGHFYAATTEGIYETLDDGDNWTQVLDVIMGTDIRLHPLQPNRLFAACGNFASEGFGIYRSLDSGANWTRLSNGLPSWWDGKVQLAIAPGNPNTIYASIANDDAGHGLYRSTNGGDSWTRLTSTNYASYQGWYSHYVVLSPHDPDHLFVGGIEIWESNNGGISLSERSEWQEIYYGTNPPEGPIGGPNYAHADHHFALWHPTDAQTVFFASDGGVFKSTDGGDSFQSLIGGYMTTQFYNGFSNSTSRPSRAIGGMQDNLTAIYDGNVAWRRVIGGDGCWTAISTSIDETMYGSWQYLNMQRSRNGGVNWSGVSPPGSTYPTAFVAPFVLAPSSPSVLYAGRNRVYRTSNEGTSWITTNGGAALDGNNPVLSMEVAPSDPDVVYVGTAPIDSRANVYRTRNGGDDWTNVTGILPDRYPSDITVHPTNYDIVYATFMGFDSGHVYKSGDGGNSWQDISVGLPDIPTSAIILDPDNPEIIYVGTDLGCYVSPDDGASWHPFMMGMPTTMINDLKVYSNGRLLRAATHGNGVYERDLYDPTGTDIVDALAPRLLDLSVSPNPLEAGSRVSFTLERREVLSLDLFDVRGRRIMQILEGERSEGRHESQLTLPDLSAGVYFLRLKTPTGYGTTRMVKLR